MKQENIDLKTVNSFGDEWSRFDQSAAPEAELRRFFDEYFAIFPWNALPAKPQGFDMGCGSGRWANFVAPHVDKLHCIDPSAQALDVARRKLAAHSNVELHHASTDTVALPPNSLDFGYSLGVLHHIPDTQAALAQCVRLLKPNAPFLVYLYYRFDNRSALFRAVWVASNMLRRIISALPQALKTRVTDILAALVYWPLARSCRLLERVGIAAANIPLYAYRHASFYTMRTDSLDRFGTPLEHRFTRAEIQQMMEQSGLRDITFSPHAPYWCAVGFKA
jgi:ubiquinone/menaquinone biosynthesis C-methylase UbiE